MLLFLGKEALSPNYGGRIQAEIEPVGLLKREYLFEFLRFSVGEKDKKYPDDTYNIHINRSRCLLLQNHDFRVFKIIEYFMNF